MFACLHVCFLLNCCLVVCMFSFFLTSLQVFFWGVVAFVYFFQSFAWLQLRQHDVVAQITPARSTRRMRLFITLINCVYRRVGSSNTRTISKCFCTWLWCERELWCTHVYLLLCSYSTRNSSCSISLTLSVCLSVSDVCIWVYSKKPKITFAVFHVLKVLRSPSPFRHAYLSTARVRDLLESLTRCMRPACICSPPNFRNPGVHREPQKELFHQSSSLFQ